MPDTTTIDFLGRSSEATMRLHIGNILDSYSHYWDILAELAQNAVDALVERQLEDDSFTPRIAVEFNCATRSIKISDNGIGVKPEWLGFGDDPTHPTILTPNTTFKTGSSARGKLIGSKGVGLTFATFCSNSIRIISRRPCEEGNTVVVECINANRWLNDASVSTPTLVAKANGQLLGDWSTIIELHDVSPKVTEGDPGQNLFKLSRDRLSYLLRSRTALGRTHALFSTLNLLGGESFSVEMHTEITLRYVDEEGNRSADVTLPATYQTPADLFAEHLGRNTLDSDRFLEKLAAKDRSLPGKLVQFKEVITSKGGRNVAAYALVVPGTHIWSDMLKQSRLHWGDDESYDLADCRPGIWLATRGMPCGVELGRPAGLPGWADSVFILLEDPLMKFDLGRKGPAGRAPSMYQSIAKKLFNRMRKLRVFEYLRDRPDRPLGKGSKINEMMREMGRRTPMDKSIQEQTGFVYSPLEQEAAVAAMFFHLVGKGILKGYRFLRSSYGDQYDAIVEFVLREDEVEGVSGVAYDPGDIRDGSYSEYIVAEFKYRASSLITDVKSDRKRFEDFKILVCWDFDRKKFKDNNINVFEIEADRRLYPGCQYILDFHALLGRDDPRLVLCLSEFLGIDVASHP